MDNRDSINSSPSDPMIFEIFIAGVPAFDDVDTVKFFFKSLGPVFRLELLDICKKPSRGKQPKRFFKLATTSKDFFFLLVNGGGPIYKGRALFCEPYKSGEDLASHSADINARRIVIKQVPFEISLAFLRELLEAEGGEIETLYEYKSVVALETNYSLNFRSYSATFKSNLWAEEFARRGFLQLPSGEIAIVEKYYYRGRVDNKGKSLTFNPSFQKSSGKYKKQCSSIKSSQKKSSFHARVSEYTLKQGETTLKKVAKATMNSSGLKLKPCSSYASFLNSLEKPTSRSYYSYKDLVISSRTFNENDQNSNIRLNLLSKVSLPAFSKDPSDASRPS